MLERVRKRRGVEREEEAMWVEGGVVGEMGESPFTGKTRLVAGKNHVCHRLCSFRDGGRAGQRAESVRVPTGAQYSPQIL